MADQTVWADVLWFIIITVWGAGIVAAYTFAEADDRNWVVWTALAVLVPVIPALVLGVLIWVRPHAPIDGVEHGYHPRHKRLES
jgi:hypothetical protein